MTATPGHPAGAAALCLAAVLLAGCGSGGGSDALPSSAPAMLFNEDDVHFAVDMSQHVSQALAMTELARTRAKSALVKSLAAAIEETQAAEADLIANWITTWVEAGAELPPHGVEGAGTGPGMAPASQVDRLQGTSGRSFDLMFLALMVRHHRGGLDLAERQLAAGGNPDALRFAKVKHDTQRRQIAEMTAARKGLQ